MDQNYNFPLETEVVCTYELFKDAARTYKKGQAKRWGIVYAFIAILIVLSIFLLIVDDNKLFGGFCLSVGIIYVPLLHFIYWLQLQKSYKTNLALRDETIHYSFYEDEIELTSPAASSKMKYEKLYSALEDDKNILLLLSARQYLIIRKEKCSDELLSFLHVKMDEINARKAKK